MSLPVPKLDDRRFSDIVNELIQRISYYCPEWTDHNVSDPGITLIELFAWMMDTMLYRMNQVPDLHYIRFMELLGITRQPPLPATAPITFWLTAPPQEKPFPIPAGIEVTTTQTETELPVIFTTDTGMNIQPARLQRILQSLPIAPVMQEVNIIEVESRLARLVAFSTAEQQGKAAPQQDAALYFGFANDLSHHLLRMEVQCERNRARNIDPDDPPYQWEAAPGPATEQWQPCVLDTDTTRGLNSDGYMDIRLPKLFKLPVGQNDLDPNLYWLRLRIVRGLSELTAQNAYKESPVLYGLLIRSLGGTVPATHAYVIPEEFLGVSDGSPGQRFQLQATPILKQAVGENLTVVSFLENTPSLAWYEVQNFSSSGPHDQHFTLDRLSGELCFGPAIRQPTGNIRNYGAIPPRGARLILKSYRVGGGVVGNVAINALDTLKSGLPGIALVRNRERAAGGQDPESVEAAKMRAPAELRTRTRAVTTEDYIFLVQQAMPARTFSRVICLPASTPTENGTEDQRVLPGHVVVLLVPYIHHNDLPLRLEQLQVAKDICTAIYNHLNHHRLLGIRLRVAAPRYRWVNVVVKVVINPQLTPTVIEAQIKQHLQRFINPITGGEAGSGWPVGQPVTKPAVEQWLRRMPEVLAIHALDLYAADADLVARGAALETVALAYDMLPVSGNHQVGLEEL